jgi:exonuclease-1
MLENGDEAGFKKLVDSIDVTPDIAYRLIVELKKKGVQYIVAPYEADAQLAYLSR